MLPLVVLAYCAGAWLDLRRGVLALILGMAAVQRVRVGAERDSRAASARCVLREPVFVVPWLRRPASRASAAARGRVRALAAQTAAEHAERERRRDHAGARPHRPRAAGHHRPQRQRDGDPGRRRQAAAAQRSRTSARVDPDRRARRPRDARRPAPPARDAPQGRRPARARTSTRARRARRAHSPRREPGSPASCGIEGEPVDLTPGVDLVGYRVVEAALRSAAHGSRTRMRSPSATGRGRSSSRSTATARPDLERSIPGLRERVGLYGGSCDVPVATTASRSRPAAAGSGGAGVSIRILIADDQALVRTGFRMILDAEPDLDVVAEAQGRRRGHRRARRHPARHRADGHPHAAIDGLEATRRIIAADATTRRAC